MSLVVRQNYTAIAANLTASFLASGGVPPYVYSVVAGGAGGTVNASTGVYTAPSAVPSDPAKLYDTIKATDATSVTATAQILIGTPLLLFCEIIQREMSLGGGRVYLWDQKIMQPTDSELYIAVSVPICKPFGNTNRQSVDGQSAEQFVSMQATLDIDAISRGPAARDRKEEIILALGSVYAEQQQEANSFLVAKLPHYGGFRNLSNVDGAAIPYRYQISVNMQYAVAKTKTAPYFSDFSLEETTDP